MEIWLLYDTESRDLEKNSGFSGAKKKEKVGLSSIHAIKLIQILFQAFRIQSLEANLIHPSPFELLLESTEIEEINKVLLGVCTTHQLPLAQIWIPCCTSTAMAYVDRPGQRCHSPCLSCSNKFSSSISQNGDNHYLMQGFNIESSRSYFRKGEGIVGKALLHHKPCFCRDVTQLPKDEYPLSNVARLSGLTGCCAIWVHSTLTMNHDYVLEFFFPPWNTVSGDPQRYLELLLATVKKQIPAFKISSVGDESCVQVCEISVNDDKPNSVRISQTFNVKPVPGSFVNEKGTVQNEVVGETVKDNESNILGLEENSMVVCHLEKTVGEKLFVEAAMADEITRRLAPMPESLRNENEVVQQLSDDEPTMEEAVRKNELNVGIIKQTSETVTSSERIFSRAEALEREYRTTDTTLSREDLTKHFGKKLDDAAKILNGNTVKRACRLHNINKWPVPKRKKINALHVHSGNEGIEGSYNGDSSCSDPPPTAATAGISHKTTNSRQEHDVGTDEENDRILLACDEDLEKCIGIWKGKILAPPFNLVSSRYGSRLAVFGVLTG
ncbi:hypothetical protein LguiA_029281 [Lonicera macranthoides]